jgi:vacuolar protein sorting-associated protein 26
MVRVTIQRQYNMSIVQNTRFWVRNLQAEPEVNNPIKMEVGIEDCLHIEFEYAKSKYNLKARERVASRRHHA